MVFEVNNRSTQHRHVILSLITTITSASLVLSSFIASTNTKTIAFYKHRQQQPQQQQSLSDLSSKLIKSNKDVKRTILSENSNLRNYNDAGNDNNSLVNSDSNVKKKSKHLTTLTTTSTTTNTKNNSLSLNEQIISMIEKECGKFPSLSNNNSNTNNNRLKQYLYRTKLSNKTPLDIQNVKKVLNFLVSPIVTNGNTTLVKHIILSSPRIIRRDVDCQLYPNVNFLKQLYSQDGMFLQVRSSSSFFLQDINKNLFLDIFRFNNVLYRAIYTSYYVHIVNKSTYITLLIRHVHFFLM